MLCRLCLNECTNYLPILSESNGVESESEIAKIINRYFYMELNTNMEISNKICTACWQQIESFHKFCLDIEQKQETLRRQLSQKIICDVELTTEEPQEFVEDIKDITLCEPEICIQSVHAEQAEIFAVSEFEHDNSNNDPVDDNEKNNNASEPLPTKQCSKRPINSVYKTRNATKQSRQPSKSKNAKKPEPSSKKANIPIKQNAVKAMTHEMDLYIAENVVLSCCLCSQVLADFTKLHQHFRKEHNCSGYISCCNNRYTKRYLYVDHLKLHKNPDLFKCHKCNKTLINRNSYKNHMATVHPTMDELKFQCEFCSKKFARQYILDYHLQKHSNEKAEHFCKICQKSFAIKYRLKKHIERVHENAFCQICNYCGREFRCVTTFKQHIADHEGVVINPPVQCSICNEWLKNKYILTVHMKAHNPTNIECQECGRICATQRVLRNHINRVHNTTHSHECTFCGKKYKKRISLKEHMGTHTGEKSNNCPHCSSIFRAKSNMYKHIKTVHKEEWLASRNASKNARSMALEEIAKKT